MSEGARSWPTALQLVELVRSKSGLPQYAAQGPDGYLSMTRDDGRSQAGFILSDELDVAASLRGFCERAAISLGATARYGSGLAGGNLYLDAPKVGSG